MLQVNHLCFSTRGRKRAFAIKDISFSLEQGYIMSLLGKNGSGKTTLLNIIYGLITPDSGEVLWQHENAFDNRYAFHNDIAYIGEKNWCFEYKSLNENVAFLSLLYENFDYELFDYYMSVFGLTDTDREQNYSELSTGQKLQFQLAFLLARSPKFMLLDEPMANLDPVIKTELTDILHKQVTEKNMGIIISTHLVDDISDITDYIGIIDDGEMKIWGDRETVFDKYKSKDLKELLLDTGGKKE